MSVVSEIKKKLYCGDCKNSQMLVWDKSSKLEKVSQHRDYLTECEELDKYYIVRCFWLKDNVIAPDKLENCQGKQGLRGQNKKNNDGDFDDEADFGGLE